MEKEFYIVEGDTRVGPLSISQLSEKGIEPSTLVWTAGMADWARADSIPELAPLLANRIQQPARPYQQPQQYGAYSDPSQGGNYVKPSTNWKTLAIIATVVGFLFSCIGGILGVVGIVQANKAEEAARRGDFFTAQNSWSTCKTLTIISFVITGIGLIFNIYYFTTIFPQLMAL